MGLINLWPFRFLAISKHLWTLWAVVFSYPVQNRDISQMKIKILANLIFSYIKTSNIS